jgi:glycosyltransferase involved in cell wall biosynthesis
MGLSSVYKCPLTVLMPVYNGDRFLVEALESIRSQTFRDYEFLIIDDGSTDGTPEILARYAAADDRIRVLTQQNRGLIASLNRGFLESTGELIARMDADDLARPQRLSAQIEFLRANPRITLVGSAIEVIDSQGRPSQTILLPETPQHLRTHMRELGCALAHPTVMFRRQAVLDVGGLRLAYRHAEDYDLWLRMLEKCDFSNLPDVLLSYRRHEGSVSNRNVMQQMLSAFCARVTARLRLRGLADPTSNVDLVTREVILGLGVDAREFDAEMFRGFCEATEMAIDQGRPSEAADFLTAARPFAHSDVIFDMALNLNRRALEARASPEEQDAWRQKLVHASPQIYRELFSGRNGIIPAAPSVHSVAVRAETLREERMASNPLNDILKRSQYDTDKNEEYMRQYDRCFAHLRTQSIALLEIGVNRGGSLYLWRDYFEHGTIVGIDLAPPGDFADPSGRCRIFQCDQSDAPALRSIAKSVAPDGFQIIIDDASHLGTLTAATFTTLFYDHLQHGGFYAIEDWGTGYWDGWPDGKAPKPGLEPSFPASGNCFPSHHMGMVGFVKQLIDECALSDVFHPRFGIPRTRPGCIRGMYVSPGLVIIEKAKA